VFGKCADRIGGLGQIGRGLLTLLSLVPEQCRIGAMTDHAIVVADADGTITWWSPGAEVLFGHSAAAAIGQSLDLIVPDALRARHWAGFHRAMDAPQVKDLAADMPVLCADRQVKEFAGRLLVLSDGLGVALGAMGIFAADGTTGIRPFG
jgi:PAS domain-containing protein